MYYKFNENSLSFEKVDWMLKVKNVYTYIPIVLFFITLTCSSLMVPIELTSYETERTIVIREDVDKISEDKLLKYVLDLRIQHPEIICAQAELESDKWSSPIWNENHNMFGMKMSERRITTAIGVNRGHAVYKNWRSGVLDYALFQATYLHDLSKEQYKNYIYDNYAKDPKYKYKVESRINYWKEKLDKLR